MKELKHFLSAERWLIVKLLLVWFLVNVLQSVFTEIGNDESYYWVYSRFLDWGYFDHPPMIALLIRMGSYFFSDELGVRFFIALIQIPFLLVLFWLVESEVNRKSILIFIMVAASVVMIQAYGFVATPDAPMLLFTALFLLAYRLFLEHESIVNTIFLSLSMVLLMYSKYHGVLVVGFVIISNLKLLLNPRFYFAGFFALLLFTPHIYWQYQNGFPSFSYHLVDRSSSFQFGKLFEFLANQLAVFNPLTLGAAFYVMVKRRIADKFERALVFQVLGFLLFFTLSNVKGYVNPHWTVAAACAIVILVVREAVINEKLQRFVFKWIAPSLILLIVARFLLIFDVIPMRSEWHGHKQRVKDLGSITEDKPLIILNQFQLPSKYMFYTHKPVHSIGGIKYRHTQYDIWNFDEQFRGEEVLLLTTEANPRAQRFVVGKNEFYLEMISNYQPYKRLKVDFDLFGVEFKRGTTVELPLAVTNLTDAETILNHSNMPISFSGVISNKHQVFHTLKTEQTFSGDTLQVGERVEGSIRFLIPEDFWGEYRFWVCHSAPNFSVATISSGKTINIK